MASLNKVMIIGNLGREVELKTTGTGQKVAKFSVAITEKYKDRNGVQQEKTEWADVVIWGPVADICAKYLTKGSSVYIEGKLQTSSWEDASGQKRYKTEINGQVMQMLGGKSDFQQKSNEQYNNAPEVDSDLPY